LNAGPGRKRKGLRAAAYNCFMMSVIARLDRAIQ
jgi:hypothetical protein